MRVVSQSRRQNVMEITTSACTQIHITHTGASVLLGKAGCHSACVEYITRAAKHATGGGRNRVEGQTLRSGLCLYANQAALHSLPQAATVNMKPKCASGVGVCVPEWMKIWFCLSQISLLPHSGAASALLKGWRRLSQTLTLVISRGIERRSVLLSVYELDLSTGSVSFCAEPQQRAAWSRLTAVLFH